MSMIDWAENEVKIACKREAPDRKEGEWDYGCACYESALKAYNSLMDDDHSGMSFAFTRNILTRLMDGRPLTPIEDTPDVWDFIYYDEEDGCRKYQCRRMSSLFKCVYDDGRITFSDNDRQKGVSMEDQRIAFASSTVTKYINEHYPITMPYSAKDKYKMICDDYNSTNSKPGYFDHEALLELYKNGQKVENFKPIYMDLTGEDVKYISKEEYMEKKPKKTGVKENVD